MSRCMGCRKAAFVATHKRQRSSPRGATLYGFLSFCVTSVTEFQFERKQLCSNASDLLGRTISTALVGSILSSTRFYVWGFLCLREMRPKARAFLPGLQGLLVLTPPTSSALFAGLTVSRFEFQDTNGTRLKAFVNHSLDKGMPVILSVRGDDHWSVIAGRDSDAKYIWIDSADENLIGSWAWGKIDHWIDNDEYYGLSIKPRRDEQLRHSLVPYFVEVSEQLDDDDLREYWGFYLEDLVEVFDCPISEKDVVTAEEFFDSFGKMITDAVCQQYLYADEDSLEWEIGSYRTVAQSHRLTMSKARIPKAIALTTASLTCIAFTE